MTTEARPVSNSVNTGAEADARLSATVASESEAHSSSEAIGEGIVVEKDVVYPAAIVNNNSKCSIYIVDMSRQKGLEI